jgi:DNA-binding beta-propeller fold protein YncE
MKKGLWYRFPLAAAALCMVAMAGCSGSSSGSGGTTSKSLTPLNLSGKVTTLAGLANASADGKGSAASFKCPLSVTSDGTNLYVADTSNHEIRKIVIATGAVSTLAGSTTSGSTNGTGSAAGFYDPKGITIDSTGTNLYVADTYNHMIRKIVISTGVVTTIAGSTIYGHADGTGSAAGFNYPKAVAIDSTGTNLYVADTYNHMIRKIVISTGVVSTLAGSTTSGYADGTGPSAGFSYPEGIITDGTNLYVADWGNNEIRKIVISTGVVTTIAGSTIYGHADGTGTSASFYAPNGLTTDGTNLFVSDSSNNEIRKIVIATGVVSTLAGSCPCTDGTGTAARFYYPCGMATDGTNIHVADTDNCEIRKIVIATGVVSTLAGSENYGYADGVGTAARFDTPYGITIDSTGTNLYVADTCNHEIRKIVIATGIVTTIAGSTTSGHADGTGTSASFYFPYGITTDGTNLYVADTDNYMIRKIVIATGVVTTLAGSTAYGHADGTGTAASFYSPRGITTDGTNLYVADYSNKEIRKIVIATGVVSTLAGSTTYGSADGTGSAAGFNYPFGITTDGTNLYVADTDNHMIRKIVIATGVVSTLAGSTTYGSADGTGNAASFYGPRGITTDGTSLYVADSANNTIRVIK